MIIDRRYDPYMDSLEMIIDEKTYTATPSFPSVGGYDSHLWAYLRKTYCTSAFSHVSVEPRECVKIEEGKYAARWYKDQNTARSISLYIDEAKKSYDVTTTLSGLPVVRQCSTVGALVLYIMEQLRNM